MYKHFCDNPNCRKELSPGTCEYGQVMNITISVDTGNNVALDNKTSTFCSTGCALEYIKSLKIKEDNWINVWKRGKIFGEAPVYIGK